MNRGLQQLLGTAEKLDSEDALSELIDAFDLPENVIYLDGNSLGPLPQSAKERVKSVVEKEWGQDLITSWNVNNWIDLPRITGEKIAKIIGAGKKQVVCCDSISVNLFKLLCGALSINTGRSKVMTTVDNFPTDGYMVQGLTELVGTDRCELVSVQENKIVGSLSDEIAVLLLTQVNFRTGKKLNIEYITAKAHELGILVVWDLAHSAGVVPLKLDEWNVDFAVGCGYKFLNGGPGAPAFVYVAKHMQEQYKQPLQGWMGHSNPFDFDPRYRGIKGVEQNLVGTPSIVSMSLLDASLDLFSNIEIDDIAKKSHALIDWFIEVADQLSLREHFITLTPLDSNQRGAQIAFEHEYAYAICQALISEGVIADFRAPNILRLGFSPLFLSFADIFNAGHCLSDIMFNERYLDPCFSIKHKVT